MRVRACVPACACLCVRASRRPDAVATRGVKGCSLDPHSASHHTLPGNFDQTIHTHPDLHKRTRVKSKHADLGGGCAQAECAHARKGLVLPRASHSGEIALAGSRRLRSTLAAAPVLFAQAVVIVAKIGRSITPMQNSRRHHTSGCLSFHARLWLSVLCMRSKAWLAARVSLRLARLPRTASSA